MDAPSSPEMAVHRSAAEGSIPLDDALQLQVLRLIQEQPTLSQRELAQALGLSLGRLNYGLRALIVRGWVKVDNFRRSNNKAAYAYVLTPAGLSQKLAVTRRFLRQKEAEFEVLQRTIETLRREVDANGYLSTRPPADDTATPARR
jgi:MarR family transcriptional regulator, temperature-dependent positive regulator of motility